MDDLEAERRRRWWQTGRPIRSIGRAGAFIDDVGFALLFPASGMVLPSLYEAASEHPVPLAEMAWGPDAQRVWDWKDDLPRKGLAWSGRLLRGGRASFLAPDLLADCYPRAGEPDDFRQAPLGAEARRIAETLLASGPLPAAVLRQAVGLQGRRGGVRFSAAVVQLGRALVCTSFGTEQVGSGWPSVVLELTARAFDLGGRDPDEAARRLRVARRCLDTMLVPRTASWPASSAGCRQLPAPPWTRWWTVARRCWRRARTGPARSAAQALEDRALTSSVRETIRVLGRPGRTLGNRC
jgi:hypothetical protein